MSPGATFERVYLALKNRLGAGSFAPGAHLEPAALCVDMNSSVTPVRDALHRLVGERLVQAPRGDGFRVPAPSEAALRDLYGWNGQLLLLALRTRRRSMAQISPPRPDPEHHSAATEGLFLEIAASSGSGEHVLALANLNDRLRPYRRIEAGLVQDPDGELQGIRAAFEREETGLRMLLAAYHRRRQRLTPELLSRMDVVA